MEKDMEKTWKKPLFLEAVCFWTGPCKRARSEGKRDGQFMFVDIGIVVFITKRNQYVLG